MPVTNYYTVNGEIIGEKTTGSPRIDYLTDALGSVTATVDQNAQVVNTYRYKPSGAQLAKTGVGSDPANRWVGVHGYRQTGRQYSDVYVRARHYDTTTGRWTTKDPLGLSRVSGIYHYANSNPILRIDTTGLFSCRLPNCPIDTTTNCYTKNKGCCDENGSHVPEDDWCFYCVRERIKSAIAKANCLSFPKLPNRTDGNAVLSCILACLVQEESSLNPHCFADRGDFHDKDTFGWFQISRRQYRNCGGTDPQSYTGLCDPDANTQIALTMILAQCKNKRQLYQGIWDLQGPFRNARSKIFRCVRTLCGSKLKDTELESFLKHTTCENCQTPKNCQR